MRYHVDSEVGQLRQAILHRPDLELKRLTPTNKHDLLFDDVLWVKRAKQEHDGFAESLREPGCGCSTSSELLRETLDAAQGQDYVLDQRLRRARLRPVAVEPVRTLVAGLDGRELTECLIGGLTKREALERMPDPRSVTFHAMDDDDFLLPPLPNHLFTRDTSCWIHDGVAINSMRKAARMRRVRALRGDLPLAPEFADAPTSDIWSERTALAAWPPWRAVTSTSSAGRGAGRDERAHHARRRSSGWRCGCSPPARRHQIVALSMPKARAFMHLDTVMTMVDRRDVHEYAGLGMLPSYTIEPGATEGELR